MKHITPTRTLLHCLLLLAASSLHAEPPPPSPVDALLFPPEFIMQNKEAIALTDAQANAIIAAAEKAMPDFEEMQKNVQSAMQDFVAALGEKAVKTDAALAQFEKMMDRQREMQRAHIKLILAIRGQLTPEQIGKLTDMKKASAPAIGDIGRALEEKAKRVEQGVARWQSEGRDPSPIGELMQKVDSLMREGKARETGEVLDQALKLLETKVK